MMAVPESPLTLPARALPELLLPWPEAADAPALLITGLTSDSRELAPGMAFVALAGERTHGLEHLGQARARGAVVLLWEPGEPRWAGLVAASGLPALAIPDLGRRLGELAARWYGVPSAQLYTVGVTGTDGKSSVSHFIAQALDRPGQRCGLIGTLGYGLPGELVAPTHTTPDPLRLQAELAALRQAGAGAVAMEVSSHALDQGRVHGVEFDCAVLTQLGRDHLDYHGDMDAYAAAKARLFRFPGLAAAVLNLDDAFGRRLQDTLAPGVRCWGYSLGSRPPSGLRPGGQWLGAEVTAIAGGLDLQLHGALAGQRLTLPLLGRFNAANLLAAAAALLARGLTPAEVVGRLAAVRGVPGRMEPFAAPGRPLCVVDYAHNADALTSALAAARAHCRGRLWLVFGAGGERDRGKRPLMGAAAEAGADELVITSDNPRGEPPMAIIDAIRAGLRHPARARVQADRRLALRETLAAAAPEDLILITGKGHEDYQEIAGRRWPYSDRDTLRGLLGLDAGGEA